METEFIGWVSACLLLTTISTQVWKQWKSRSSAGVSSWLFVGQISASAGFVVYSYLLGNPVFVLTNGLLLCAAILGQCFYLHNRRCEERKRKRDAAGERAGQALMQKARSNGSHRASLNGGRTRREISSYSERGSGTACPGNTCR